MNFLSISNLNELSDISALSCSSTPSLKNQGKDFLKTKVISCCEPLMMEENYAISMKEENFVVISYHPLSTLRQKVFFFRKKFTARHLENHFFVCVNYVIDSVTTVTVTILT